MENTGHRDAVTVERYMDYDNTAFFARGNFDTMFAAYLDHVRRWEKLPDGLSRTMMRQGLGAAALYLACRPYNETVAWTLNIVEPPLNLFLTGDSTECAVTGRVITEGVRTVESSRLFVESRRVRVPVVQSSITVTGWDVLEIFEQYYRQSEQSPARFFEMADSEFVVVMGLPETDRDWIDSLDGGGVRRRFETAAGLDQLDSRLYRFQCGCSPQRQLEVIRVLYENRADELFQRDDGVETFCPRCGRRWWIKRSDF